MPNSPLNYGNRRQMRPRGQSEEPTATRPTLKSLAAVDRALMRASVVEVNKLESRITVSGHHREHLRRSSGLFGTVIGIMMSFQMIGETGSTNLASVGPGIAEALVATAFGLIAAVPAVVAYNHFSQPCHACSRRRWTTSRWSF